MQTYAETRVDGVLVVVYAEPNVGRIYARAAGVGGSGLTVDDAISDCMDRWRSAEEPTSAGYITPPRWHRVPLKDIRL